jgi:hypothetical protein
MSVELDSPNDVINQQVEEPVVMVRMSKQLGSLNPGDIAGFPTSKAAKIVADKAGVQMIVGVDVDADGNPLRVFGDELPAVADDVDDGDGDGDEGSKTEWKFDAKTDPFVTDGISQQASKALHARGMHTVDAVRMFIAATPVDVAAVDAINEIEGVTDAQAEKIVKLYGMVTEHSEE